MTRTFIVVLCLMLNCPAVSACDCSYEGPFLKMAKRTKLVALIRVTRYLTFQHSYGDTIPLSMEVEVIDSYKGKEGQKRIVVWGDNGFLCRPYLSTFDEKQYYVMALYGVEDKDALPNEKKTDYFISGCGAYWLTVDNRKKIANGDMDSKDITETSLTLKELKRRLKKHS